ncbi:MAG: addiction module protein [Bacteroidota bacterium]
MSELQQYILGLSVKERLELITFIASSIDPSVTEQRVLEEWITEAKERDAKYLSGKSKAYTWDQIKSELNGK